jgi:uncharacterized protein YkwD
MTRPTPWCPLVLLSLALLAAQPAATPAAARDTDAQRAARLHGDFDHFRAEAERAGRIDVAAIDHDLLSAAVFHETNRRRARYSRAALTYRAELQEAARIQARGMVRAGAVSHQHPEPDLKTLADRLRHVGVRPAFSAENTAMSFAIQYTSGTPVYSRTQDGRVVFSYEPDGEPIPPHTYRSFAEALLDEWMRRLGHRRNILDERSRQLGTGHARARDPQGMDTMYSVQVFFAELEGPRRGKTRQK